MDPGWPSVSCAALPPSEPPREHLLHRGKIIRRADAGALDVEFAIQLFVRHTLLEHDHRADDGHALRVGDIVTFDAVGRRGQIQRGLQFGERLFLFVRIGLPLGAQGLQGLGGVLGGHLHQLVRLAHLSGRRIPLFRRRASTAATGR